MTRILTMHQATSTLSQLVVWAHEEDEIIFARAGGPVATIVAYQTPYPTTRCGALPATMPQFRRKTGRNLIATWPRSGAEETPSGNTSGHPCPNLVPRRKHNHQ
jgi:antitoxin (DNA-binding transcriptional repressor) of toxin-antitoxin stability system